MLSQHKDVLDSKYSITVDFQVTSVYTAMV